MRDPSLLKKSWIAFFFFFCMTLGLPVTDLQGEEPCIVVPRRHVTHGLSVGEEHRIEKFTGRDYRELRDSMYYDKSGATVFRIKRDGSIEKLTERDLKALSPEQLRRKGLGWIQVPAAHGVAEPIRLPDGRLAFRSEVVRGMSPELIRTLLGRYPEEIPALWDDSPTKGNMLIFNPRTRSTKWVDLLDFMNEADDDDDEDKPPQDTDVDPSRGFGAEDNEHGREGGEGEPGFDGLEHAEDVPEYPEGNQPKPGEPQEGRGGLGALVEDELGNTPKPEKPLETNEGEDRPQDPTIKPDKSPVREERPQDQDRDRDSEIMGDLLGEIPEDSPLNDLRREGSNETLVQEWMRVTGSTLRPSKAELLLYLNNPENYQNPRNPYDRSEKPPVLEDPPLIEKPEKPETPEMDSTPAGGLGALVEEEEQDGHDTGDGTDTGQGSGGRPTLPLEDGLGDDPLPGRRGELRRNDTQEGEPGFEDLPFGDEVEDSEDELRRARERADRIEQERRDNYEDMRADAEEQRQRWYAERERRRIESAERWERWEQERLNRDPGKPYKPDPRHDPQPRNPDKPNQPEPRRDPPRVDLSSPWERVIARMEDTKRSNEKGIKGQKKRLEWLRGRVGREDEIPEQESYIRMLEQRRPTYDRLISVARSHKSRNTYLSQQEWDTYDPEKIVRAGGKWAREKSYAYDYFRSAVSKNGLREK